MSLDGICYYEETYGRCFNFDGQLLKPEVVGEIIALELMRKSEQTYLGDGNGRLTVNYLLQMLRSTGRYGAFCDSYPAIESRRRGYNNPQNQRANSLARRSRFVPHPVRPLLTREPIRYIGSIEKFEFDGTLLSIQEVGHIIARTLMDGRERTVEADGCFGVTVEFLVNMLRSTGKHRRFCAEAQQARR